MEKKREKMGKIYFPELCFIHSPAPVGEGEPSHNLQNFAQFIKFLPNSSCTKFHFLQKLHFLTTFLLKNQFFLQF